MKLDLKKKIIIGAIALVVVIVALVCLLPKTGNNGAETAEDIAAATSKMHYEPYRQLYVLKNTTPDNQENLKKIMDLTNYYNGAAKVTSFEQTTDLGKKGITIYIEAEKDIILQTDTLKQQATVMLALMPELDFVAYHKRADIRDDKGVVVELKTELYRRYQQFGENNSVGGKVFTVDEDGLLSEKIANGEAFVAFMEETHPTYESDTLHNSIGKAIMDKSAGKFRGYCVLESHTSVSAENVEDKYYASVLYQCANYRFVNGKLLRIEETQKQPLRVVLAKTERDTFVIESLLMPKEELPYQEQLQAVFEDKLAATVLANDSQYAKTLNDQEVSQAEAYAKGLGRTAEIGNVRDANLSYLEKLGISDATIRALLTEQRLLSYPLWVGTQEFEENGVWYGYETIYKKGDATIVFRKYDVGTKQTVEEFKVSATDGAMIQ